MESSKSLVKVLIEESLAPPRSQSFSGVMLKQVDKSKTSRDEFQKRCTLSLDKSTKLLQKNKSPAKNETNFFHTVQNNNLWTSNVIQRTKTFSKYLSLSRRETGFKKSKLSKEKRMSNGIVSAQSEFLLGFDSNNFNQRRTSDDSISANNIFLAKVKGIKIA